ncbi:MAG TPA: rod shape-determining protein [Firmicutes bacterium]|nr:rod shape-determining protein [Bacillota bacterium]
MILFENDIAIDLGTSNILAYVRGKGIALREPSVVAVDKSTGRLLKAGEEAQKMLGRTPANIVAIHPISAGVISDYDMTVRMMKEFLSRITSFSLFKPRVICCVPSSVTGVEERAIVDAIIEAGARKVYLLEKGVATATGAGIDISRPDGHMVIDIGGGTTEVAVVSLGGVAECESIKIAGNAFDESIVKYIRRKHNVLIGTKTAEEIKLSLGCVYPKPEVGYEEIKGRCLVTGMPRTIRVSSTEMVEALAEPCTRILEAIHMVLERTPPELVSDISVNGIVMSGGGSLLWGFDKLIAERTGIPTVVVDDPLSCAAYGAGRRLLRIDEMQEGMLNIARRRQLRES